MSVTRWRRTLRSLTPGLLLASSLALLWRATGGPDFRAAASVVHGAPIDRAAGIALSEVIVWCVLLAVAAYSVAVGVAGVLRKARGKAQRVPWAIIFALSGAAFLVVGLSRHQAPSVHLCCGSLQEAQAQIGR